MLTVDDYGALNGLARHRVRIELIVRHWDDLLRVAGSLKMGAISASELTRSLLRSNRPSTLDRAIGELVRVAKTLYLLSYLYDETYRRRILTQLNRVRGDTAWPGRSSTASVARSVNAIARARKTNSGRWAWWSTWSCSGTPCTWTRRSPICVAGASRRSPRTLPASRRWDMRTSTSWDDTHSRCRNQSPEASLRPLHDPEETDGLAGPSAA